VIRIWLHHQFDRFLKLTVQFFQMTTRRTLALLDESQNSSLNYVEYALSSS